MNIRLRTTLNIRAQTYPCRWQQLLLDKRLPGNSLDARAFGHTILILW